MNIRSKSILEAAVKEYIKSGEPVSSKGLAKRYKFGVKDATIRSELSRLAKEGFLTQLHTSGGRVPTDKGYQFFVEQAFDDAVDTSHILNSHCGELADKLRQGLLRDFIEEFADTTRLLGAGQSDDAPQVYKSGLDDLFDKLDLETRDEINEVVRDFEDLDKRMKEVSRKVFKKISAPEVFIGEKSPLTKSRNLSVIVDSYPVGDYKFFVAIIGPKRMDYNENLSLLRELKEMID